MVLLKNSKLQSVESDPKTLLITFGDVVNLNFSLESNSGDDDVIIPIGSHI